MRSSLKSKAAPREYPKLSSKKPAVGKKASRAGGAATLSRMTEEELKEMGRITTFNLIANLEKVEF